MEDHVFVLYSKIGIYEVSIGTKKACEDALESFLCNVIPHWEVMGEGDRILAYSKYTVRTGVKCLVQKATRL